MIAMVRILLRLCIVITALGVFSPIAPSHAQVNFAFVSPTGSGIGCTIAQPCDSISTAIGAIASPLQITCINGDAPIHQVPIIDTNVSIDIDCPLGTFGLLDVNPTPTNATLRLRHVTFPNLGFGNSIQFLGGGTLILEDCVFADASAVAFDIEPNGRLNLVIRNSRISNSAGGMLLKPAASGSINATFDHVTIADNTGGGIRIDTTNGPVTLDVTDSVISNNTGTGINTLGNAGGQAIVSIKNSVIARNGGAGVQANGANAGVLLQTTLLDQNTVGATSVVNGGNMFTYGNNSIVGPIGSGFTSTAALH